MKQEKTTTRNRAVSARRSRKNSSRKISASTSQAEQTSIQDILQHLNSPVNIFDHRKKKFLYVNDKFARLVGMTAEECYSGELKVFGSWIHEDDLSVLQNQIGKRLAGVYLEYIRDHTVRLSYLVNFRLKEKEKNGRHASVLAEYSVMKWNANHSPAITLNILSDITHYRNNQKMILMVNLFDKAARQWKTILNQEFLSVPPMLSVREKQIIEHIVRDKSATKISQELNIPFYTVRSHWRNILQKTRCKTQKELKNLAHTEGWV